ncbi:MAG TPA: 2-oxoglutarate dehydrogenase complex dihydrolipoyllysine-residue succinyltransferase [Gammaproteobacteria bacterium]
MSIEVKVPQLPESVADATLVAWHKKAGESVRRDENLVDLETDKVVLEVPAPSDGIIKEIKVQDGSTVTAGQVLAVLETGDAAKAAARAEPEAQEGAVAAEAAAREAVRERTPAEKRPEPAPVEPARLDVRRGAADERRAAPEPPLEAREAAPRMGPAVRKLVEEHDIDPAAIRGSGREGRVTKADVLDYLASTQSTAATAFDEEARPSVPPPATARAEQRVAMTRLRRRIAERLVEAQRTAAMLTTFNEVDMTAVMELRRRYQEEFQKKNEIKLGFMSFFVRASIEALRQFPLLNASIDGTDIIYHEYFDIGVAVSSERGLLVPVLRNAENMSFAEIEKTIADFARRAGTGDIGLDELTGGTFTITNGGVFGSLMSTPIINPPQSGILGMHKIQERPMAVDGKVEIRPMMYLALTYDHRIVDGREAVQFLVHVKRSLEDPARLILQI